MKLAIIPARGGSKRIPRKNVKRFAGLPIIAWSIKAALQSECFDRIIVSTDDDEIASVAQKYGAAVPFKRPSFLSDDYTGTTPVIAHAIDWHKKAGFDIDCGCCIYATAPFVKAQDLQNGLRILEEQQSQYAFSATTFPSQIHRGFTLTDGLGVNMLFPENFQKRSQDLPEVWHDAGQFYWGRAEAWLAKEVMFEARSAVVPLPRYRVQDIDTAEDWALAEKMMLAFGHD